MDNYIEKTEIVPEKKILHAIFTFNHYLFDSNKLVLYLNIRSMNANFSQIEVC